MSLSRMCDHRDLKHALCLLFLCCAALRCSQVLPGLLGALTDPEGDVRGAAAFALGQFSEYLQPDITHHHQAVLPAVFRLLQDPSTDVQERACYGEAWNSGQEGCRAGLIEALMHLGIQLPPCTLGAGSPYYLDTAGSHFSMMELARRWLTIFLAAVYGVCTDHTV